MPQALKIGDFHLLTKGVPPPSSYWVGATREQLHDAIAARRPVQASGDGGLAWDNSIQAEASLRRRLSECKVRAALRRAEAERLRGK